MTGIIITEVFAGTSCTCATQDAFHAARREKRRWLRATDAPAFEEAAALKATAQVATTVNLKIDRSRRP